MTWRARLRKALVRRVRPTDEITRAWAWQQRLLAHTLAYEFGRYRRTSVVRSRAAIDEMWQRAFAERKRR